MSSHGWAVEAKRSRLWSGRFGCIEETYGRGSPILAEILTGLRERVAQGWAPARRETGGKKSERRHFTLIDVALGGLLPCRRRSARNGRACVPSAARSLQRSRPGLAASGRRRNSSDDRRHQRAPRGTLQSGLVRGRKVLGDCHEGPPSRDHAVTPNQAIALRRALKMRRQSTHRMARHRQ